MTGHVSLARIARVSHGVLAREVDSGGASSRSRTPRVRSCAEGPTRVGRLATSRRVLCIVHCRRAVRALDLRRRLVQGHGSLPPAPCVGFWVRGPSRHREGLSTCTDIVSAHRVYAARAGQLVPGVCVLMPGLKLASMPVWPAMLALTQSQKTCTRLASAWA